MIEIFYVKIMDKEAKVLSNALKSNKKATACNFFKIFSIFQKEERLQKQLVRMF